ncbi:hypothetical protein LTR84_010806 [Exophiala bonariae]|uniref:Zn(2)-C6 fungal-type domain-containing protein n=1 Tax=Exophiala bonariae TaxID=1690606 RepID=A0AAV9NJX8_9EURO|nr:hypothetical protein LTR84_010806 [Exophiala bonariae]
MDLSPAKATEFRIIVEAGEGDSGDESGAGLKRKRQIAPCDYHQLVCTRCQKNGERCIRSAERIKFRHGSSARYDVKGFAASQIWLKPTKASRLRYVDETAEIAAIYGQVEEASSLGQRQIQGQQQDQQQQVRQEEQDGEEDISSQSQSQDAESSEVDTQLAPPHAGDDPHVDVEPGPSALLSPQNPNSVSSELARGSTQSIEPFWQPSLENEQNTPFQSSPLQTRLSSQPSATSYSHNQNHIVNDASPRSFLLDGLAKSAPHATSQTANSELEVTLLRYFIDVLACWFDICDPEKHFALIVPPRARWCPPLKNAILAASARHLTRVCNPNSKSDFVYFHDGEVLPSLTEETALHYHTECVKDLVQRSMNMEQTQDASLLAAAIILRFYEEIDAPLREDPSDSELFLRVINVFIDAQTPNAPVVPHSSPVITGPEIATDQYGIFVLSSQIAHSPSTSHTPNHNGLPSYWRADGLRQAGFWVAFRQEIHSAFLKQRSFNLSLSRCEAFRSFSPAEDAVWADRLIVFCADVLEFCYNDKKENLSQQQSNQTPKDQWLALKQYEKTCRELLPASFEPIFFRDPDRSNGEVFPRICYMVDCHVVGVQYVDLAKILLSVYDPTRPKLGPGYTASMRSLAREVRAAVLRLCGIAMSNRKCPPALVTAYLGIAICGDYFEDPLEQDALLGVLDEMETRHAWPAGNTRQLLKEAWGKE